MANERAIEMFVGGVVLDPSTQAPIVILKDESGQVNLPIWIGMAEATSIASAIKQVAMARPLTHDVMYTILMDLSVVIERIVITELRESTYYAELVLRQGERAVVQDCRPSDAIALALRASAPIFVTEQVLDHAKTAFSTGPVVDPASQPPESTDPSLPTDEIPETGPADDEEKQPNFASVDKDKWKDLLQDLDPDDFKYKT
jgi:bifunctional DNase/RNase